MTTHSNPGPKHKIFIDDKEYDVTSNSLSGAQLKVLASLPSDYQLFLEQATGEDRLIGDSDSVQIHSNMKFYSMPPATFG